MTIYVDGLGQVPTNTLTEYTSPLVSSAYNSNMLTLQSILNEPLNNQTATAQDYSNLLTAIAQLKQLAFQGVTDSNLGGQFFMTGQMLSNVGLVLNTLSAAGIPPATPVIDPTEQIKLVQAWQSLAGFGVAAIVNAAASPTVTADASRSLQSMIELEYVQEGNNYINNNLQNLENQLQTTQNVVNTLTTVQNIANEVTVSPATTFNFPPKSDADFNSTVIANIISYINNDNGATGGGYAATIQGDWNTSVNKANSGIAAGVYATLASGLAAQHNVTTDINNAIGTSGNGNVNLYTGLYKVMASAHFTQVYPTATPNGDAINSLLAAKTQLMTEVVSLEKQGSATRSTLNSLPNFVYQVALDISSYMNVNTSGMSAASATAALTKAISAFIIDNQGKSIDTSSGFQAGKIQTDITNAINAAQSVNTTQQQNVNNFEFIFQQFFTSASTILSSVSQIVQTFAQGIQSQ